MRVSVVVPTYRRTRDLERCLEGLAAQRRQPNEVLVVVRSTDTESRAVLIPWLDRPGIRMVPVEAGGQVNALNAGLDAATGELVMITDDDAAPREDWVERVEALFAADARLGGVGGRDVVHLGDTVLGGSARSVGRVQWFGRLTGNHHLVFDSPSHVDILKGANMSYRAAAIDGLRFDVRLRGAGAQVGNDMAFSFAVGKRGWRLLYDPLVIVDHYPAPRFDNDQRGAVNLVAVEDMAFNTWWALRCHLGPGPRRLLALLWEHLVGTRGSPGLVREWVSRLRGDLRAVEIAAAARRGRAAAAAAYGELE
jgi:cellulose synthase/poly-beta-1,6-N-acetylglucosamine synthase-like glycosyltransferase